MKYFVELKPKAIKDLKNISKSGGRRIVEKLKLLEDNLQGDVKKLTNHTPEYRMRVGDRRILQEVAMTIHPQIIEKEGKKEFVVLPYEEFLRIQEALENFEDLKELRKEKEESKNKAGIPLSKITEELNL